MGACENPTHLYSMDVAVMYLHIQVGVGQNTALHLQHADLRVILKLSNKSFLRDGHLGILQLVNGAASSPWLEERAV